MSPLALGVATMSLERALSPAGVEAVTA